MEWEWRVEGCERGERREKIQHKWPSTVVRKEVVGRRIERKEGRKEGIEFGKGKKKKGDR